jgi:hypothetical protein
VPAAIDSLKFKLRAISVLKNQPDRVYDLIDDLMNHYFITETRRPAYLLHVMVHAYEMAIQSMKHPQMGERDLKLLMAYDELLGLPAPVVGVMPPSAKPDEEVWHRSLDDPITLSGAVTVILRHQFSKRDLLCTCGKQYLSEEEWAAHLRRQLWAFLRQAPEDG